RLGPVTTTNLSTAGSEQSLGSNDNKAPKHHSAWYEIGKWAMLSPRRGQRYRLTLSIRTVSLVVRCAISVPYRLSRYAPKCAFSIPHIKCFRAGLSEGK